MLFLCLLFAISMENKFSANSENTQKKKRNINKTVYLSAVEKQSQILGYWGLCWIKPLHLFSYLVIKSFWEKCCVVLSAWKWQKNENMEIAVTQFYTLFHFIAAIISDNKQSIITNKMLSAFGLRQMHNNDAQQIQIDGECQATAKT